MGITVYHIGVVVKNLDKAVKFYTEGLGLECEELFEAEGELLSRVVGVPGARMRVASLVADDGVLLVLVQYLNPKVTIRDKAQQDDRTMSGSTHIAFMVENALAMYRKLRKMGATAEAPPIETIPGHKTCYMQDPDGNWIELVEDKAHASIPFKIRQSRLKSSGKESRVRAKEKK
jgi:catechol 2,3-dioxygenase-like lactoylglutathione lyase family enzyme